jgi:hypothetical protein
MAFGLLFVVFAAPLANTSQPRNTADFRVAWKSVALPAAKDDVGPECSGVVCSSKTDCVVSGFDDNSDAGALSLTTTDGGASWSWRYHAVTAGVDYELDAVQCTAKAACLAMGSATDSEELAGSVNGEATWYPVEPPNWQRKSYRVVPPGARRRPP